MFGEPDLSVTNQSVHLLRLLRIERTPSTTHFEQQHTERPEINVFAVSFLVEQNFRGEISFCQPRCFYKGVCLLGSTAESVGKLVV